MIAAGTYFRQLKSLFSFAWLFILTANAGAQIAYTVETVPNPRTFSPVSNCSNPDSVFSSQEVNTIDSLCFFAALNYEVEIGVVAVNEIDTSVEHDQFATDLFSYWGIGPKATSRGLLVLLVMQRRKVVFRTGYGLEQTLTDELCQSIQEELMVPEFKKGNFGSGTADGLHAVLKTLQREKVYWVAIYVDRAQIEYEKAMQTRDQVIHSLSEVGDQRNQKLSKTRFEIMQLIQESDTTPIFSPEFTMVNQKIFKLCEKLLKRLKRDDSVDDNVRRRHQNSLNRMKEKLAVLALAYNEKAKEYNDIVLELNIDSEFPLKKLLYPH